MSWTVFFFGPGFGCLPIQKHLQAVPSSMNDIEQYLNKKQMSELVTGFGKVSSLTEVSFQLWIGDGDPTRIMYLSEM